MNFYFIPITVHIIVLTLFADILKHWEYNNLFLVLISPMIIL